MPTPKSRTYTTSWMVGPNPSVLWMFHPNISSSAMHIDQEKLKMENANLVQAFREKSRKHQQTQELYDRLKRKEMTAATQSAAFESVDEVLQSATSRQMPTNSINSHHVQQFRSNPRAPSQPPLDYTGTERLHNHQRVGSGGMMPPPSLHAGAGYRTSAYGSRKSALSFAGVK